MTVAPRPFDDFSNRATRVTVSVVCRPNSVPLITTAHQVCRLVSSSQIRLSRTRTHLTVEKVLRCG